MKKVNQERENQPAQEAETIKGRKRGKTDDGGKQSTTVPTKKAKTVNDAAVKVSNSVESRPKENPENKSVVIVQPITDPSRHANTVFLSNLDFNINEEDIRTTMSASGTITDIRLVRDYKQRSKGFCYVEFSSQVKVNYKFFSFTRNSI